PKTDDALANELSVKVNEVRRVLNLLSGYGITKYDTEKDSKGWLTFNWYVDYSLRHYLQRVKIDAPNWPQKCSWIGVFYKQR
ncbi:MAG: hypothetical protein ACP5MV_04060, partial [Candidatus Parvarchaeum sp.]